MERVDTTSKRVPLFFPLKEEEKGIEEDSFSVPIGLLEELKKHLDIGIYTWDTKDFAMPFPDTLPRTGPAIQLGDLFRDPDYQGEILELAYDSSKRTLRKLDFLQFQEIRNTGEFSVPSVKFPGQVHVWRITQLLQKGWKNVLATARKELAFAIANIIVWIPNRLYRSKFSIPHGVKLIFTGVFWTLPTILWGWPEKVPKYSTTEVSTRLNRKRNKYLLEELKFSSTYNIESNSLASNQVTAVDGTVFDFRLFNKRILDKVSKRLREIQTDVDAVAKKKGPQWQQQFSEELKKAGGNESNFALEIANRLELESQRLLQERIRTDPRLEQISEGIYLPIFEMLETERIEFEVEDEIARELNELVSQTEHNLRKDHPILSLIPDWINRKLDEVRKKFDEEHKHTKLERCIALAQVRKLGMSEYFFRRNLYFNKERAEMIQKVLEKEKVPARVYEFNSRIWNPKNWKIENHGTAEHPSYHAKTYETSTVASDTVFWRWQTMFYRTATYWNNSLYALYRNIVQGPLSFRSLFSPSAYNADTIVDKATGMLKPGYHITQSFASRLKNLWKGVFQSRKDFEDRPDVGFLGKSIVRVFNLIWNYVMKGLIGTTLVVLVQPVITIANILVSTLLVLTSMLWCPLSAILVHLFAIFIYDHESPCHYRVFPRFFPLIKDVLVKKLLYGGLQVVGSAAAILVHFLGFFLVILGCGVHTGLRSFYDFVMFYMVIRWRARIPAQNSFAARRIHGPGISRQAFFQIDPDLALVALQVKMEIEELTVYEETIRARINQAKTDSMNHIHKCLAPLGLNLSSDHPVARRLQEVESTLSEKFRKRRTKRLTEFPFLVDKVPNRDRIVLERKDLESTLRRAIPAVEHFYTSRIFPMKTKYYQEQFWEGKSLLEGDFAGLTRALLSNVFSARFLSPLEEADKKVALKIQHTGVHQYAEGLMDTGAIPDDLTIAEIEYPNYYQPGVQPTVKTWKAHVFPAAETNGLANDVTAKYKKLKGIKH